jgi:hypothetical protein
MVDAGRGTTLSRRRLVGAKTPCRAFIHHLAVMHRVRFAFVGGIRSTSFSISSTPIITSCRRPSGRARFDQRLGDRAALGEGQRAQLRAPCGGDVDETAPLGKGVRRRR